MISLVLSRSRPLGGRSCGALNRLRGAYFAQAAESAARYHVTFDRVIKQLWQARQFNRRLLLRSVICMDDLVHATACVDEIGLAWADLAERYERAMIRRCRGSQEEIEATLFVRRLLADLRRRNQHPCSGHAPSLRCYSGVKPLRNWLNDRLNAARMRAAIDHVRQRPLSTLCSSNKWERHSSQGAARQATCNAIASPFLFAMHCSAAASPVPIMDVLSASSE